MPLEQTTTMLESISIAKTGKKKDGDPWVLYDFKLSGYKRPWKTFNKDLADMALQGKMVRASGSAEDRTFTGDAGQPITYTEYTLQNIELVEGDTGTLNDIMAPIAARENDQAVATQFTAGGPTSPSEATKSADISRAVAFKGAVEVACALINAGSNVEDKHITELAAKFEPYLTGRS